jgi:hypothetical protein
MGRHRVEVVELGAAGTLGALREMLASIANIPDDASYTAFNNVAGHVRKLEVRWDGGPNTDELPVIRAGDLPPDTMLQVRRVPPMPYAGRNRLTDESQGGDFSYG